MALLVFVCSGVMSVADLAFATGTANGDMQGCPADTHPLRDVSWNPPCLPVPVDVGHTFAFCEVPISLPFTMPVLSRQTNIKARSDSLSPKKGRCQSGGEVASSR